MYTNTLRFHETIKPAGICAPTVSDFKSHVMCLSVPKLSPSILVCLSTLLEVTRLFPIKDLQIKGFVPLEGRYKRKCFSVPSSISQLVIYKYGRRSMTRRGNLLVALFAFSFVWLPWRSCLSTMPN